MKIKKVYFFDFILLFLIAFLFVFLNSSSISPFLNRICDGTDSAMFQVIGKGWLEGKIPYADLWDSKGPLIFFINMVGYAITKSRTGIFIINVAAWFVTTLITFKMFSLEFDRKKAFCLTSVIIFSFSLYLGKSGNNVTDYSLPFIMASLYYSYRYFVNVSDKNNEHNYKYAFVYGMTFSVCLMMRLSDAVCVCVSVAIITLSIIVKRQWSSLIKNMLMFLSGFSIVFLPFFIYFVSKGLGYDFIYGTLLYNLSYVELRRNLDLNSIYDCLRIPVALLFDILLFSTGIYVFIKEKESRWKGLFFVLISFMTGLYFLKTYMFLHYAAVSVPYGIIVILETKRFAKRSSRKYNKIILNIPAVLFLSIAIVGSMSNLYNQHWKLSTMDIAQKIPKSDLEEFVAYNVDSRVYLELDCLPCYKYFAYQDWAESRTEKTKKEIKDIYSEGKAKWILFKNDGECLINDILDEKYDCVETDGEYKLYKLK